MRLIGDLLLRNLIEVPDKPAMIFDERVVSYRELLQEVNRAAGAFEYFHGLPGNRIAILLDNCPEFVYSYFGAACSGNVAVPVNYMLQPEELVYILNNCQASCLVTRAEYLPRLAAIRERVPALRTVISIDGNEALPTAHLWRDAVAVQPPSYAPRWPLNPHGVMVFLYTSGTTGFPKAAMCTHQNLLTNVETDVAVYRLRREDVCSCVLPMFHNYSVVENILLPFWCGCTIVIGDLEKTEDLLQKIERRRISVLATMPMQLSEMVSLSFPRAFDTSSLRLVQSGGAALPTEVQRKFQQIYGKPVVMGYGCSEACASVTEIPLDGPYKDQSVGLVLPNQRIRIVDEDDRELPAGQDGEILINGPNVCLGYYGLPEETRKALRGGWLHTGDVGRLDEEGYLFVTGRKKSMVNVGGLNVYPAEVEEVLHQIPGVVEACVVASYDPMLGETVKAFIEPAPGGRPEPEFIIRYCEGRLAHYKVPRQIEFRDHLPRTGTGKIAAKVLQEEERRRAQETRPNS